MAQDIVLMGATFHDVPAVELSKDGGGTALFTDVSDTDAVATDVASGKKFYLADGSAAVGAASGGGLNYYTTTITKTAAGTLGTITHNLNSTNIAVYIYPISDTITATAGYQAYYNELVSMPELLLTSVTLDCTPYNSSKMPNPVTFDMRTSANFRITNGHVSPWTTQNTWNAGACQNQGRNKWTITANSIATSTSYAKGTYRIIVVDMTPIVNAITALSSASEG